MTSEKQYLPNSEHCFVCGEDNAAGLQTRFYVEDGVVKTQLKPKSHHCGYHNVIHGGVVAAILDETMGWAAARAIERMCLTGELKVRYQKPVPGDRETVVTTELVRSNKLMAHVKAQIVDENGTVYARAEGKFIPLSVEDTLEVDDNLIYRGGEERVFDRVRAERDAAQA